MLRLGGVLSCPVSLCFIQLKCSNHHSSFCQCKIICLTWMKDCNLHDLVSLIIKFCSLHYGLEDALSLCIDFDANTRYFKVVRCF